MTRIVTVTQDVAASADEVFECFVSPKRLAEWWWPHLPTTYEVDPRVGGGYSIVSDVGIGVEGEFVGISRPDSISITWRWLDDGVPGAEEPVEVSLTAVDGRTAVEVVHACAPESAENLERGWTDVLDRLASLFDG